jgi:hypothetical protein
VKEANISSASTKTIPFKTSIIGQQKELEIWSAAIDTLNQRILEIKKIAQE